MTEQVEQNHAIPPRQVCEGWDEAFAEMAEQEDDRMLDESSTTLWEENWER